MPFSALLPQLTCQGTSCAPVTAGLQRDYHEVIHQEQQKSKDSARKGQLQNHYVSDASFYTWNCWTGQRNKTLLILVGNGNALFTGSKYQFLAMTHELLLLLLFWDVYFSLSLFPVFFFILRQNTIVLAACLHTVCSWIPFVVCGMKRDVHMPWCSKLCGTIFSCIDFQTCPMLLYLPALVTELGMLRRKVFWRLAYISAVTVMSWSWPLFQKTLNFSQLFPCCVYF